MGQTGLPEKKKIVFFKFFAEGGEFLHRFLFFLTFCKNVCKKYFIFVLLIVLPWFFC